MPQKDTSQSLTNLMNIGKVIAKKLEHIGITTKDEFLKRDPYGIFNELLFFDSTLCRCALASIVGAHANIKWNIIHKKAAEEFGKRYPKHTWKSKC